MTCRGTSPSQDPIGGRPHQSPHYRRSVAMVQDWGTGRACGLCNTLDLSGPKPGAAMWSQLCAKGVPDNARCVNWSLDLLETRSGESKQSPRGGDEVQTSEGRSGTREMTETSRR